MKTHNLIPGTPEWLAYRRTMRNASDASAMMGCNPNKTRNQLLHELHTTLPREFSDYAQKRILDPGHAFEALARPLADAIIGEELFPVVGSMNELSASFDGLTMDERLAWEHKRLNAVLRACMNDACTGADLPIYHRIQMEQQLIVSGAERALFMASEWDGDRLIEERHCWYTPDAKLRADIIAGWAQFAEDLAAYVPVAAVAPVVATAIESLPAVVVQVQGELAVSSNLTEFGGLLRAFIDRMPAKPSTDQEFADTESACKALKKAEDALEAAETNSLAQLGSVEEMRRMVADLRTLARTTRLASEKLVSAQKDAIRLDIVSRGRAALAAHVDALNVRLGRPYMPSVNADFVGAVKGKRTLASLNDAVDTLLANTKIEASATADRIHANLTTLRELASAHAFLFSDAAQIVLKAPDDLTALVKLRISEHQAAEEKKAEALRESIRKEEQGKLAREQAEQELQAESAAELLLPEIIAPAAPALALEPGLEIVQAAAYSMDKKEMVEIAKTAIRKGWDYETLKYCDYTNGESEEVVDAIYDLMVECQKIGSVAFDAKYEQHPAIADNGPPTLRLGQIAERLGFTLTADFLTKLGFAPAGKDRAAVLYHEADFAGICDALVKRIVLAGVLWRWR